MSGKKRDKHALPRLGDPVELSTELTGLLQVTPDNDAAVESYQELAGIPWQDESVKKDEKHISGK